MTAPERLWMIAPEYQVVIANAVKAHMRLSPEFRKQIAAYVASAGTEGENE